jgi:hypothetical protein
LLSWGIPKSKGVEETPSDAGTGIADSCQKVALFGGSIPAGMDNKFST